LESQACLKVRFTENSDAKSLEVKLDLVGAHEVRWNKGDSEPEDDYTSFCGFYDKCLQDFSLKS